MSNLGNQASQCSLDKVAGALPSALKKNVLQSLNLSTFVWVIKNKDDANKIVKVLRENGFSNISLDSKGTTITAQSSSGSQSAGNDTTCTGNNYTPECVFKSTSDCTNYCSACVPQGGGVGTTSTSGLCPCQVVNNQCQNGSS